MKIAVTYENGQIFQHFGHTEQFKLYTVEDGKIVSTEIVDPMSPKRRGGKSRQDIRISFRNPQGV